MRFRFVACMEDYDEVKVSGMIKRFKIFRKKKIRLLLVA